MTNADLEASKRAPGGRPLRAAVVLAVTFALGAAGASHAGDGKWSIKLKPMFTQAHGHDQHVLTIHEIDLDASPQLASKSGVNLNTGDAWTYFGEFQYARKEWGLGVDFFWFDTTQGRDTRSAAAAGPSRPVVFEVADRRFTSTNPGEVLYFGVLEDTDFTVWTVDLYGFKTLAERPKSEVRLRFGVRFGDFDNDYRGVVGIRDVAGRRLDASSNYGLMIGPLVGLSGIVHCGRSTLEGYIGQSVILGTAELSNTSSEFTGPFSEMPAIFAVEDFRVDQDVAIPITELRLEWSYRIGKRWSLGVGVHASTWWDVPVPPGVIPVVGGDQVLHENTVVFVGGLVALGITFGGG